MTPSLRRRHRLIWLLLTPLLLIGWFAARAVLPQPVPTSPAVVPPPAIPALPFAYWYYKTPDVMLQLRKHHSPANGAFQLDVIWRKPWSAAAVQVYADQKLVGTLHSASLHRFSLGIYHKEPFWWPLLEFKDDLNQKVLLTVNPKQ